MINNRFIKELNKGMPIITYVKKKYGFTSIEKFEAYIEMLKEKGEKYDAIIKNSH